MKRFQSEMLQDFNELIDKGYIADPSIDGDDKSDESSPSMTPIKGSLEDID